MRVIDPSKYQKPPEKPKAESVVVRNPRPQPKATPLAPIERTRPQLMAQLDEQVLEIRRDRNKVSNRARERWKSGADEIELAVLYTRRYLHVRCGKE